MPSPPDTATRILETCHELFMKYGVRSVTMDDVATNLGVSKKTIYQHFPDKREIVLAVAKNDFEQSNEIFKRINRESENPLMELIAVKREINQKLKSVNPALLMEVQKYYPSAWQYLQGRRQEQVLSMVGENLEKGVAAGYYRPDLNVAIATRMYLSTVEMIVNMDLFPSTQFQPAEVQSQAIDILLRGFVTEKGRQLLETILPEVNA